jgi:hypothetical protein
MDKFEKELLTLKDKLLTAKDFREPYQYFFDNLAENSIFLGLGKRAKNPLLKKILTIIGKELFKEDVTVTNLLLTKIRKHHFYHGPCFIQGKMAGVIFFEDIDMGMLSIVMSLKSYETSIVRFSSVKMESDKTIFFHPTESTTIH